MKEVLIKESTEDFVDSYPTVLCLYNTRKALKAMTDHVTHAATRDKPFIFRMSSTLKTRKVLCPKCKYDNVIPVLYGYMDGDEFEDHKQLLKLEQEGRIDLPGCDATDGYNLQCKGCGHSWEWKLGYDWQSNFS